MSITAPERMWPPISADFSTTVTAMSGMLLLEPDGGGEAGRTGADDDDVGGQSFAVAGFGHGFSSGAGASMAAPGRL